MQLSFHLFILLFGFVLGNLFPTFFGDFLGKVGTPVFLFLALDFFNYFYYTGQFLWQKRNQQTASTTRSTDPDSCRTSAPTRTTSRGSCRTFGQDPDNGSGNVSSKGPSLPQQLNETTKPSEQKQKPAWTFGSVGSTKVRNFSSKKFANQFPSGYSSFATRANSLKIGFLFGLFVDAFKVGS